MDIDMITHALAFAKAKYAQAVSSYRHHARHCPFGCIAGFITPAPGCTEGERLASLTNETGIALRAQKRGLGVL